jgi:hypothetical protein
MCTVDAVHCGPFDIAVAVGLRLWVRQPLWRRRSRPIGRFICGLVSVVACEPVVGPTEADDGIRLRLPIQGSCQVADLHFNYYISIDYWEYGAG